MISQPPSECTAPASLPPSWQHIERSELVQNIKCELIMNAPSGSLSCLTTVKALHPCHGIARGSWIADGARCSSVICTLQLATSRTYEWLAKL